MTQNPPTLPGMTPPEPSDGPLTLAARATLDALEAQELLEDRHAITKALVLQLSQAVDRGLAMPKVSVATATLSKHLLEAVDALPQPVVSDDAWADFTAKVNAAAEAGRA